MSLEDAGLRFLGSPSSLCNGLSGVPRGPWLKDCTAIGHGADAVPVVRELCQSKIFG